MILKVIAILNVLLNLVTVEGRYDGHVLYKIIPQEEAHLKYLQDLFEDTKGLDFWDTPTVKGDRVNILVPLRLKNHFEHSLKKRSIHSEIVLENIQQAFDAELYSRRKRATENLQWSKYLSVEEIYDRLNELTDNDGIISVTHAGQSYEGRNITGIKISRGVNKPVFLLEGGQVGADWLSPTLLTYIADQLVKNADPEVRAATEEFEWHIFPVVNPDGNEYSRNSERLWLKNRRPTRTAVGVDLTKNWNSQWGVRGGSFKEADDNYVGLGPFSEPETRSLSFHIEDVGDRLKGMLSFRSFGQKLLIPFAHSVNPLYNYNEMVKIGRRAMGSLAVRYNTQYIVGTSAIFHDGATGNVADWVKHRFNPPIVATYLLRDKEEWGYALPESEILPSCEETFDSLLAIIREAKFINILQ